MGKFNEILQILYSALLVLKWSNDLLKALTIMVVKWIIKKIVEMFVLNKIIKLFK